MEESGIRVGFTALFLAVFAWERLLEVLNLRKAAALRESDPPPRVRALLDREDYRRAIDYTLARGRLGLAASTLQAALVLAVVWSGFLGWSAGLAARLPLGPVLQGVAWLLGLGLLLHLVFLPFSLARHFGIERRFGFNRMGVGLFLLDRLKGLLLSAALLGPLLAVLLTLIGRGGRWWWLAAFGVAALFQLARTVLGPALIAPLFNRFTPLPEGPLRRRIEELAGRMGFRPRRIFVADSSRRSSHSNAYLTGLGKGKRIVLFDTLLAALEEEQVLAVLAHEVGHARHHHLWKGLALFLGGTLAAFLAADLLLRVPQVFTAFGLGGPGGAGLLAVLALLAGPVSALLDPLSAALSRRHEYQADRASARALGRAGPLVEALLRLGRGNLANPVPHPLYSAVRDSHPALPERIRALEELAL